MLSFPVFAKLHLRRYVSRDLCGRRLLRPCRGVGVYPEPPRRASDCPILFHFPNSQLSTFNFQPPPFPTSRKSFICNIYAPPRKCCKQKTYSKAKPFRCNIYTKPGGGGKRPMTPLHPELGGNDCGAAQRLSRSAKIQLHGGGDTVSTEAVAARRHAGTHLPVTWWKLELPTTTWHLPLN